MLAVGGDKMWSFFLEADENEADERRGISLRSPAMLKIVDV